MAVTYSLRLTARNVRGVVRLQVETLAAARALATAWQRDLGKQWTVEVVDNEGVTQWTI